MFMSIGAAASYLGVSVVTLRRWDRSGALKPAWRTASGHRRYDLADLSTCGRAGENPGKTVAYARVSSHDQREDLERQAQRLKVHCEQQGWSNPEIIQDLGRSGLNYKKRGLSRLLKLIYRREISCLVIQCKDRLLRFGSEIIFSLCKAFGIRVEILEPPEDTFEDRLAADVIELMTVLSARLYGRRAHKNRTKPKTVESNCRSATVKAWVGGRKTRIK